MAGVYKCSECGGYGHNKRARVCPKRRASQDANATPQALAKQSAHSLALADALKKAQAVGAGRAPQPSLPAVVRPGSSAASAIPVPPAAAPAQVTRAVVTIDPAAVNPNEKLRSEAATAARRG